MFRTSRLVGYVSFLEETPTTFCPETFTMAEDSKAIALGEKKIEVFALLRQSSHLSGHFPKGFDGGSVFDKNVARPF